MRHNTVLLLLAFALLGCVKDPRTRLGYSLSIPAEWGAWSDSRPPVVPGDVLEAYSIAAPSGPGSLVVLRSGYLPNTTADQLLVQTRYLLLHLPSLELKGERAIQVAGKPAMVIECVAQGTGASLSPTGRGQPVPPQGAQQLSTRRVWLRLPLGKEEGTLEVLFHCPEADYATLTPAWEGVLASLKA